MEKLIPGLGVGEEVELWGPGMQGFEEEELVALKKESMEKSFWGL